MKSRFYKNGLRFECTGCGNCCSNPDGYVTLTAEEAGKIAAYLEITETEFLEKYADLDPDGNTFKLRSFTAASIPNGMKMEQPPKVGDCIFLHDDRCIVYPVRPLQCSTFPFWPENVKSPYRWKIVAQDCPGIDEGRVYLSEEIEAILALMKK